MFDEQIKANLIWGRWRQIAHHFISNQVKSPSTGTKRKFCLRYHNYYQPLCIHIDATLRRTAIILNKDTPTKRQNTYNHGWSQISFLPTVEINFSIISI